MNTGDLVLFRGRGFIPWIIRVWTRSAYDHCGVLWIVEGVPMVIEARYFGGVSCHALANRQADSPFVMPSGRTLNVPLALAHLGDWYSIKNAVGAGMGFNLDHAGWECAQFAAFILGMDLSKGWTPQRLGEAFTG